MRYRDFPLAVKLGIGFGLLILITIVTGMISAQGVSRIITDANMVTRSRELQEEMKGKIVDHLQWAAELNRYLYDPGTTTLNVETDPTRCALGQWYYGSGRQNAERFLPSLAPVMGELDSPHSRLHRSAVTISDYYKAGEFEAAEAIYHGETVKALTEVQSLLNRGAEVTKNNVISDRDMLSSAALTRRGIIVSVVLALILGVGITLILTRNITGGLKSSIYLAKAIADGDLTREIEDNREDEVGQLAKEMGKMSRALKEITSSVKNAAGVVASGSQQLRDSSTVLASGSNEQASTASEVLGFVDNLMGLIKASLDKAVETAEISGKSAEQAVKGGEAVEQAIFAMKDIAAKIKIIDNIARETNILALNASMEAARAGEFGRGFKPVAARVGELAKKSREASIVIEKLSAESVTIVEDAGARFSRILPDIKNTAALTAAIKEGALEQNRALEEVARAINLLNGTIQSNASEAEELSAMAEELNQQADLLQSSCSYFRS